MNGNTLNYFKKTILYGVVFLVAISEGNAHFNDLSNDEIVGKNKVNSFLISETSFKPSNALTNLTASIKDFCHILCYGGNNAHASVEVSGGTSPYTYLWSNGATTQKLTQLTAGIYEVTVTDANGNIAITEVHIKEPSKLEHSITKINDVSVNGGSDGSAKVNVSGGTKPYTYEWDNGETTATAKNLKAGKHTVIITDKNGCSSKCVIHINEPDPEECESAGDDGHLTICIEDEQPNEDTLFAALTNADPGGTWSGPVNGVYTYTIEASGSCPEDKATVTVKEDDAPSAGDDGELTICVGDEQPNEDALFAALTNADAGGTWSGPINGVYTYTIEASGSCPEDKAIVTVKEDDAPSAGDDGELTICVGDEQPNEDALFAALTNADAGGTWSGPINGVYTYTIEASGSCPEDKATVTVKEDDAPSAGDDGELTICVGDEQPNEDALFAALTNADAGGTWSGPINGVYTYTIEASGSCPEDKAIVTVKEDDAPSAGDDGELTICVGDEQPNEDALFAALTNADAGGTWSGPINGVYTYTIEASGSCPEDKATVTVKEDDAPSAGDDGELTICVGDEQPNEDALFAALTNADAGGTWSGPINGVYTYTIEASGSCPEDKAIVTVKEDDAPSAGDDGELTICVGDEQPNEDALFAALTNADAGGTWSGPINGVYTYTIEASGSCPEDKAIVTVKEDDAPSAGDDGELTICVGDEQPNEDALFAALTNADAGGTWSGPINGVYTYTIEASGSCPEDKAIVTITEEDCVEPPEGCETAFAKDDADNDTCFLEFEDNQGKDLFNRWGWTNYLEVEGTYTMDLYAGAGQCIINNGVKSGTVIVSYEAGKVVVEINLEPGFVMQQAHLYVGEDPYPVNPNNNKPTVAPGQYPYNAGTLNDVTSYKFEPSETFSGDIYVIVHAVTCFNEQTDKRAVSDTKASIYQKPQSDVLNVDLDINYEANVNVNFQDLSGRTVLKTRTKKVSAGTNKLEYNLGGIPSQVLIMKVYTGREILSKKILMIK